MESCDIIDINRKPLGYTKERGVPLLDNEYNQGAELWNFYDKKLLITQRAPNKSHPGEWEVPGGCSQASESSDDSINREILEEVGYKLNNNYILIGSSLYKHNFVDLYKSNIDIDINNCILQDAEVSGIKYVTKEEFYKMNDENKIVKSVFNRYLEHKEELEKDW
jgi:8-oxo-dGTP pyrophosphatase MutT (NUDIX family)